MKKKLVDLKNVIKQWPDKEGHRRIFISVVEQNRIWYHK
jgi:hypothetical protein